MRAYVKIVKAIHLNIDTQTMPTLKSEYQEYFCIEFARNGDAIQSALRAGYSPKHASRQAQKLLKQNHIMARIKELNSLNPLMLKKLRSNLINELASFAFANISDVLSTESNGKTQFDLSNATEQKLKGINLKAKIGRNRSGKSTIKITVTVTNKLKALKALLQMDLSSEKLGSTNDNEPIPLTFKDIRDAKDL